MQLKTKGKGNNVLSIKYDSTHVHTSSSFLLLSSSISEQVTTDLSESSSGFVFSLISP